MIELTGSGSVCLHRIDDHDNPERLEDIELNEAFFTESLAEWNEVTSKAHRYFDLNDEASASFEMVHVLENGGFDSITQHKSLSSWMETVTSDQLRFIQADSDHALKLRGPAGSGKTLALELKVLYEIKKARDSGKTLSVLFLTHSWALAAEVDANLNRLTDLGPVTEVVVLPLLAVAEETLPPERSAGLQLVGEDSQSGKMEQLARIELLLEEFLKSDWITFQDQVSAELRNRFESEDLRRQLVWDLLIEFGSVIGANGIFPGMNAVSRYEKLPRSGQLMPLPTVSDRRAVFSIYEKYVKMFLDEEEMTSDQLINDFLNYLETFAWNVKRDLKGHDQIFVDEFHLFNEQERQLLGFLTRQTSNYPKIYMALDPRQAPWSVYPEYSAVPQGGAQDQTDLMFASADGVDLLTIHRFTPQILGLIQHLHREFPNLELGEAWDYDFSAVSSSTSDGPKPHVVLTGTRAAEQIEIYNRAKALSQTSQLAIAVIDNDLLDGYVRLVDGLQALRLKVNIISSRDDIDTLQYRRRGVIIAPAEYLAGLQFEHIYIVGMPEFPMNRPNQGYLRRRILSLIYLAVTRATTRVTIFLNREDGGLPDFVKKAHDMKIVSLERGSEV
ncbi:UvrD-helicase domain-containing protein [Rhodococcoides fascians]|uniref:UvrD-helicase domain-containing protein n=1 Tax=Rhodococcoides fascians TaxID=1828 RepID=UPI0024B9EF69|nr:UvrD-helicase domain-containing protein [Rhodococcus fascians]MDJ0410401.1 hypothetical protein [Rhodococcus fascians]